MPIRAIAFDFDGVLVESLDVKSRAFARLFASEEPSVVDQIIAYHERHLGISRFEKFRAIYRDILRRSLTGNDFNRLCERFASLVVDDVVAAPWVEGAVEFLHRHRNRWQFFIVSGTPEDELRRIVEWRSMATMFRDVLGAPRTKDALLRQVLEKHRLSQEELVFVGDAEADWHAARNAGVRFVWRQARAGSPDGFTGPAIPDLRELERCCESLIAGSIE